MILGIIGGNSPGFSNWVVGDAPFVGGISGIVVVFMLAGFSFKGTEVIGITSGETLDPTGTVPKAINNVFWRILLFYLGGVTVIGFLVSYMDPNLSQTGIENVAYSPFTLVFERAGLTVASSVMNAVILTSVLSMSNCCLFISSRVLHALALEGKAPRKLSYVNKHGVPIHALNFTTLVGAACFLATKFGANDVYFWLITGSTVSGFLAWMSISISHLKFRRAYIAQGNRLEDLKYKARWYPIAPIFSIIACAIIILGQILLTGDFSLVSFMVNFVGLFLFFGCYLGFKIVKKTKIIGPLEADIHFKEE
jgi:lysine-specific permease